MGKYTDRWIQDRWLDAQMHRQIDKQIKDGYTDRCMHGQVNKLMDGQMDRKKRSNRIDQTRLDQNMVQWKRREKERIVWSRVESRVEQKNRIEQIDR